MMENNTNIKGVVKTGLVMIGGSLLLSSCSPGYKTIVDEESNGVTIEVNKYGSKVRITKDYGTFDKEEVWYFTNTSSSPTNSIDDIDTASLRLDKFKKKEWGYFFNDKEYKRTGHLVDKEMFKVQEKLGKTNYQNNIKYKSRYLKK